MFPSRECKTDPINIFARVKVRAPESINKRTNNRTACPHSCFYVSLQLIHPIAIGHREELAYAESISSFAKILPNQPLCLILQHCKKKKNLELFSPASDLRDFSFTGLEIIPFLFPLVLFVCLRDFIRYSYIENYFTSSVCDSILQTVAVGHYRKKEFDVQNTF